MTSFSKCVVVCVSSYWTQVQRGTTWATDCKLFLLLRRLIMRTGRIVQRSETSISSGHRLPFEQNLVQQPTTTIKKQKQPQQIVFWFWVQLKTTSIKITAASGRAIATAQWRAYWVLQRCYVNDFSPFLSAAGDSVSQLLKWAHKWASSERWHQSQSKKFSAKLFGLWASN